MATRLEFTAESGGFAFASIFEAFPDAAVELERVVPTGDAVISYAWVSGVGSDGVEELQLDRDGVLDATFVDGVGDDYLFRVTWDSDHEGLLSGLARSDVSVLSAVGTSDGWTFEVRGDDREAVAEFHTYCRTRGVPITVVALHDLVRDREEDGLTAAQRDALLYAYERGYFDSPRTATLEEVAEGLDISRQALAARLQRGHRRLIENALVTSGG